jgi:uncharacterized protein (DUF302 family)
MKDLGMHRTIDAPFDEVVERVTKALQSEGFGILTEIDVAATLKKKLDVDFRPYRILGACNPPLAYRALQAEPNIGLMLPCNVVVRAGESGTEVAVFDPMGFAAGTDSTEIGEVAKDAAGRLRRALDAA